MRGSGELCERQWLMFIGFYTRSIIEDFCTTADGMGLTGFLMSGKVSAPQTKTKIDWAGICWCALQRARANCICRQDTFVCTILCRQLTHCCQDCVRVFVRSSRRVWRC